MKRVPAQPFLPAIPAVVKTGLSKEDADSVAAKLRESSLIVELKEKVVLSRLGGG
jgi:ribosomal protein L7/L12